MPPTATSTLTTTQWVGNRIHRHTPHMRAMPHVPTTTCLAVGDRTVLAVSDGADRCTALARNPTHFARRQRDLRPISIPGINDG